MNKKSTAIVASATIMSFVPFLASAQASAFGANYIFNRALTIISFLIYIAFGVATMVFLWGVIQYVIANGDEKKVSTGRQYMLWGIIGLSVMVGVWGFVNLVIATVFGGVGLDAPMLPGFGVFGGGQQNANSDDCAALLNNPGNADALRIAQCALEVGSAATR